MAFKLFGFEITRAQSSGSSKLSATTDAIIDYLSATANDTCPIGNAQTYRAIRANPTIALARAIISVPLLTSSWGYEASDDVDDSVVQFVRTVAESLRSKFIADALTAIEYGYKPFEIVWSYKDGKIVPEKLKPLAVEKTDPVLDNKGNLVGAKNYDVTLEPGYFLWVTHDSEDGNPYGRSRYENVRTTSWWGWQKVFSQQIRYVDRIASPIPMIQYPPGVSKDASGTEVSNREIAARIAMQLGNGKPVVMPNTMAKAASDLLDRGVPVDKLKAWIIDFLEVAKQYGYELVAQLSHFEALMMRGMLTPERTATEGQYGTKADAEAHGNLAISICQLILNELTEAFNSGVIDPLLEINYGPEMRGKVKASAASIIDEERALLTAIMSEILKVNPSLVETWLDVDTILDMLGLPKSRNIINAEPLGIPEADKPSLPEESTSRGSY